jgi:hypothetical protein
MQRSIDRLQKENTKLQARVDHLQRICDDHNGQLKVMLTMLNSSVKDNAVRESEKASLEFVKQYLDMRFGEQAKEK